MRGQGKVLVDDADLAPELLQHLAQHLLGAFAEGSLVVGELHDGDGRVGGAANEGGLDRHLAGLGGAGHRPEQYYAQ